MKLDELRKLHQRKFREEFGHFLVEGEHLVLELEKAARDNPALRSARLYLTGERAGWPSALETQVVSARQMARLSETREPQGIVAVVPLLAARPPVPGERAIYLHEIRDPGNLGTILRTLAWFGGFRCLLGPGSVDPYNAKAVRASAGAIFHVPFETGLAVETLPGRFARIACLVLHGEPVRSERFRDCDCYVFGNEARGLPARTVDALRARAFTVPGCGAIESLNLASVVNMCVYELNR
jgi:TrmH family RNA methyltransferase